MVWHCLYLQGTFNGVSGGMLLYIALVMLIAEDFTRRWGVGCIISNISIMAMLPFPHSLPVCMPFLVPTGRL
jgi:hypothetical protein